MLQSQITLGNSTNLQLPYRVVGGSMSDSLMELKQRNGLHAQRGTPRQKSELPVGHVNSALDATRNSITASLASPRYLENTQPVLPRDLSLDTLSKSLEYPSPPRVLEQVMSHDSGQGSPQANNHVSEINPPEILQLVGRSGMLGEASFEEALRAPSRPPGANPGPGPGPGQSTALRPLPLRSPGPDHSPSPRTPTPRPVAPVESSPSPPFIPPGTNRSREMAVGFQSHGHMPSDKEWTRIKSLRAEIWSLRSRVHENRKVLKEKQDRKSEADNIYFQFVRTHRPGMTYMEQDISKERKLFQDCEAARDEYGPLEYECTLLENDVGIREYELQKLEERLYDRPIEPQDFQVNELDVDLHSSIPSTYNSSEMGQQFHPLVSEYLSKVGDVRILQERLDGYEEERDILEEEKEKRQIVNLALADEDQKWLDNYSKMESDLLHEIEAEEEEAERLRQECFLRGLVDEMGEPTDFEGLERQAFINDEVDPGHENSEYIKFPTLLPHSGSKKAQIYDAGLKSNDDSHDLNDRVSPWLLHQTRMSPLAVHLLASTFELQYGEIEEGEKWQMAALASWYKDEASRQEPGRTITSPSSGLATQAPPNSRY